MATIKIDPMTRLEGHLKIEVTTDTTNKVTDAKSSGTMYRGFENILKNRNPRDAAVLTRRICGVCPTPHAMASVMALEDAFDVVPPANGVILRNLILGADFIMSHVLHFYHLAALDFINTTGILDLSPWIPRYTTTDMVTGTTASTLVNHYVQALAIRRKAHQMGAIFSGKHPHPASLVPGGNTEVVTADKISAFGALLKELREFINTVYIPDVITVANAFPSWWTQGIGCKKLLAYGVFDLDGAGKNLLKRGRADLTTTFTLYSFDQINIREYIKYSHYKSATNLHPSVGITTPATPLFTNKPSAYSWIKAPRYMVNGSPVVYEVGPLARMVVSYLDPSKEMVTQDGVDSAKKVTWLTSFYTVNDIVNGALAQVGQTVDKLVSVLGRHAARALESKFIADAMYSWLNQLVVGGPVYTNKAIPQSATGIGLTEAPRGALGHWVQISNSVIYNYQAVVPTTWNASPKDDLGQLGPIEQALKGLNVGTGNDQLVRLLRVVHSFDPCLACSIHIINPKKEEIAKLIVPAISR